MSSRKIKDAKDLSTNELIYFKGHAKATYMSNGWTVEDAINNIEVIGGGSTGSGTITGVSVNGTSVATSGVANIPAASTSAYGVTKLSSSTSSTSTTLAATASAVKSAYDLANGKQAKLVSGTNIKTINGESILGSGNIVISGGGSTSDIPVQTTTASSQALTPNVYYKWTNAPTSLTITLETPSNTNILNNYMFEFSTGSAGCTLALPSSIKWANGETPVFELDTIYQISIVNDLGVVQKFK